MSNDMIQAGASLACDEDSERESKPTLVGFVRVVLLRGSFGLFCLSAVAGLIFLAGSRSEPEPGLQSPSLQLAVLCVGAMVVCYIIGLLASRIPDRR